MAAVGAQKADVWVLELSSFQLEKHRKPAPDCGDGAEHFRRPSRPLRRLARLRAYQSQDFPWRWRAGFESRTTCSAALRDMHGAQCEMVFVGTRSQIFGWKRETGRLKQGNEDLIADAISAALAQRYQRDGCRATKRLSVCRAAHCSNTSKPFKACRTAWKIGEKKRRGVRSTTAKASNVGGDRRRDVCLQKSALRDF